MIIRKKGIMKASSGRGEDKNRKNKYEMGWGENRKTRGKILWGEPENLNNKENGKRSDKV